MPHSIVTPAPIIDDTQARIDRIEQRIRYLHVSDGVIGWDGYDDLPVVALPVEFRMPDIERYTRIGCPRIHLQLCSAVMRGHRLDEAQMIMLFPLSLSGAAQRWFASLDPSRRRMSRPDSRPDPIGGSEPVSGTRDQILGLFT